MKVKMIGKLFSIIYTASIFFIVSYVISVFDFNSINEAQNSLKFIVFSSFFMSVGFLILASWQYIYKPVWKTNHN